MSLGRFNRQQYGLLVAALSKNFGLHLIATIEDSVQFAVEQSLSEKGKESKIVDEMAWLYKVAYRYIINEIETQKRRQHILDTSINSINYADPTLSNIYFQSELKDSFLSVLFFATNETIPLESQLVFILKSLCGFSVDAISQRLFISNANVYKRYERAKRKLQSIFNTLDIQSPESLHLRLNSTLKVLYVMFTEGYFSSHPKQIIRKELCDEALRLTLLILESECKDSTQCRALIALMYLNLARFTSREDDSELILLEEQDRSNWDTTLIQKGMYYLEQSAIGSEISRFHIEASIAAQDCLSPSFPDTNWQEIINSYELLETVSPSPMHTLNKAIAVAEHKDAAEGLAILMSADSPAWLICSYYWYAVLADLQFRCDKVDEAEKNAIRAIELAKSEHIATLLKKRFSRYD